MPMSPWLSSVSKTQSAGENSIELKRLSSISKRQKCCEAIHSYLVGGCRRGAGSFVAGFTKSLADH